MVAILFCKWGFEIDPAFCSGESSSRLFCSALFSVARGADLVSFVEVLGSWASHSHRVWLLITVCEIKEPPFLHCKFSVLLLLFCFFRFADGAALGFGQNRPCSLVVSRCVAGEERDASELHHDRRCVSSSARSSRSVESCTRRARRLSGPECGNSSRDIVRAMQCRPSIRVSKEGVWRIRTASWPLTPCSAQHIEGSEAPAAPRVPLLASNCRAPV